ncbi:MAG: cation-translocating P-type ATPase, partial [Clostridia bacterium]|nr:cation-translocating P-type ATPase [Clostridia bacterium]
MIHQKFTVTGMSCAACRANVEKTVSKLDGVHKVDVNLLTGQMTVDYDENTANPQIITDSVKSIGYGAEEENNSVHSDSLKSDWDKRRNNAVEEQKQMKHRLVFSIIMLIPLMYISMGSMAGLPQPSFFTGENNSLILSFTQFLLTIPVLTANRKFFISGFKALKNRVPNMDSLVALGSGSAFIYGIFAIYRIIYGFSVMDHEIIHQYSHSLYFESSAMILTLVTVGKYLET